MTKGARRKARGARRKALLAAALLVLFSHAGIRAEVIDRVLAVVSGQIITQSDLNAAKAFGMAATLDDLINRRLMLTEVRRVAPPDPAADKIDARVAEMRARFPTDAAATRALADNGVQPAALREFAADDLRLAAYLDERFSAAALPTDDEVRRAGGESARASLTAEHRQTLINAWLAELRRRAEITVLDTGKSRPR